MPCLSQRENPVKERKMTELGGYAGNILFVDLTLKKIEKTPLSEDLARNFIGNRGVNVRLLYDLQKAGVDPLSSESPLVFGSGPFMGTIIPTSGRNDLSFKSPLNGLLGNSSSGQTGMIKLAGYDFLVITGKADRPVYLKIDEDDVTLRSANELWGKDVFETTDYLWSKLGREFNVTCIGPAGENLYRDGNIANQKFGFHGQSGSGAVMGSKNLKAIAVKGSKRIEVAEPKRFKELADELFYRVTESQEWVVPGTSLDTFSVFKKYGTLAELKSITGVDNLIIPYKNFQELAPSKVLDIYDPELFLGRMKEADMACMSCPIGCKHLIDLKDGKYQGLNFAKSCVAAIIYAWGSYCAVEDFDEAIKCAEMVNKYGMDLHSTAMNISLAIELYEEGVINKEDTGGLELTWGNAAAIQEMIRKIAFREGFGDVLADGQMEATQKIGKGSESYTHLIRGFPTFLDNRAFYTAESFGQLTGIRGGHSQIWLASPVMYAGAEKLKALGKKIGMLEEDIDRIMVGPKGYNVPRLTKWLEDFNELTNMLGWCAHATTEARYDVELASGLYSSLTGIEVSPKEMIKNAERVWNLEKAFNAREGVTRKDDLPPKRFMSEELKVTGWKGKGQGKQPLDEKKVNAALAEYYEERGWDVELGLPTRQKYVELGLEDVVVEKR